MLFGAFKKNKLPAFWFVVLSLATFIILGLLFFVVKTSLIKTAGAPGSSDNLPSLNTFQNDPLTTRFPKLKDILNGPLASVADPALGPSEAKVTVVQFSDFACQFCRAQEEIIKQIMIEYAPKIRLIWKDYPERNPASVSWQAAIAGRCAAAEGKFWAMHDLLYQSENLNREIFISLAEKLRLNEKKFESCLDNQESKNLINDNIEEANALNINGVPFLFVNQQEVMGEVSLSDLKKIIDAELK